MPGSWNRGSRGAGARSAPAARRPSRGCRALAAWAAALLLSAVAPRAAPADVTVGLVPSRPVVAPGDTFTISVVVLQAGSEFNAFDASILFEPARVSNEPMSPVGNQRGALMVAACSNTFHRFDAAPDSLEISLSLLCNQTFVTGPGEIYRVVFRAGSAEGSAFFSLGSFTEFYRAGIFVRPVHKSSVSVQIGSGSSGVDLPPSTPRGIELAPPAPNPCRHGGGLRLDFSLPAPEDVSFEILDLQGRRLASRPAERFGGGRHRLSWSPPPLGSGDYFVRLQAGSSGCVVQRWTILR